MNSPINPRLASLTTPHGPCRETDFAAPAKTVKPFNEGERGAEAWSQTLWAALKKANPRGKLGARVNYSRLEGHMKRVRPRGGTARRL
jgi:hypothetical protein